MNAAVVTSFSHDGARLYGRKMVTHYAKHWPETVPLIVYADVPTTLFQAEVRLTSDLPEWMAVKKAWRKDPAVHGCLDPAYPRRTKTYTFLWDAARFAVKLFVIADAAERLGSGVLTWLDGDTMTTAAVAEDFTSGLLGDADVAYLGRGRMYPETGYIGLRIPEALPLLRWCVDCYRSGDFRALRRGWTDCHVFQAGLRAVPVKALNLTRLAPRDTSHVWEHSPLAPYMVHLKGRRLKAEGVPA